MDKYRLVVFGDSWDVYQYAHRDWIEDPKVRYISTFRPSGWLGQIQRLHFNPRLNRIIHLPYKPCWNSRYVRGINDQHICFLVTEPWLRMESAIRLLPYLRRRYPQSYIVCFVQDMVDTICDLYTRRPIDLDYLRQYADLLISYDTTDSRQHQMLYHPTVYSPLDSFAKDCQPLYDLYFLGRDKGRLPLLMKICQEAQRRDLRCHFLMLEIPKTEQISCEGITYLDSPLSYEENLRLCSQSRCVVEMLQQHAASSTFRMWETIMLNRKLLTNNVAIKDSAIYDTKYISVFEKVEDIDWSFVETKATFPSGCNPYQQLIRPLSLIQFIEQHLHIQIEHS